MTPTASAAVSPLPETGETPRRPPRVTARRRLLADRFSRAVVVGGGFAVIASILGILVFIVREVWPLTRPAEVTVASSCPVSGAPPLALLTDEYRQRVALVDASGRTRVVEAATGQETTHADLPVGGASVVAAVPAGRGAFAAATSDGRVFIQHVGFTSTFVDGTRSVAVDLPAPLEYALDPGRRPIARVAAEIAPDGESTTIAAATADGLLVIVRETGTTNAMTGAVTRESSSESAPLPGPVAALLVDADQQNIFAGSADGRLLWWRLRGGVPADLMESGAGGAPITAMARLLGDRALVVGRADGSLSVWFPQLRGTDRSLVEAHRFPAQAGAIRLLAPTPRGKGAFALDAGGALAFLYSTSERVLWSGRSPVKDATAITIAPKSDGAALVGDGRLATLAIEDPHPEISWHALFAPIWYEGYAAPDFTWQSSSGTEDFEPKFSLTPLLFGTLKGTVYSLVLAVPLGVLSAMFASQFLHPSLKRIVKPTVEIMASLPSVVLGFLAGLWLAPLLERVFPSMVLMVLVLPLAIVGAGAVWERTTRRFGARVPPGSEVFFFLGVLAAGVAGCLALEGALEAHVLGGTFPSWLSRQFRIPYDQHNAIVVGLAMGFAVTPIIFAIAEDAFSNVPRNLVSGSLALGATRWQTVTRIVLPTASPGIFAAVMVGFGRAVGETMIVLMATGNTPIMDGSPFSGFRTLSANIATEIPEAPVGGTLYRTLFLAALLLFLLTFVANTLAELVRQRLRRKYASL